MGKPQGTAANIWTIAAQGDKANLERLLDEGEPPDLRNKLGETAAHLAARNGHAQILLLLGGRGAELLALDNQGRTAVHAAAAGGHVDCLRALAGPLGCRLDGKDSQGNTPLAVAKGDTTRRFLINWLEEAKTSCRGPAKGHAPGSAGAPNPQAGHTRGTEQGGVHRGQQGAAPHKGRGGADYHSSRDVERQQQRLRLHRGEGGGAQSGREDGASSAITSGDEAGSDRGQGRAPKAVPSSQPLQWQPLEHVGTGGARMPRCSLEETGFTLEGMALGMPKRPAWRGVIRTAEQLHELEERSFQAWQESLAGRHLPVSFYEPRLEFWRQLWRVLELSDIVVMIVDARNPLLHFSHALTRHVIDDHASVPILVLNKCDLIPPEAIAMWRAFFHHRYPELRVVAASTRSSDLEGEERGGQGTAGAGKGAGATGGRTGAAGSVHRGGAAAILEAVLSCRVWREEAGGPVQVSELVGGDVHSILDQAQRLNTISKRAPAPPASAIRQGAAAACAGSETVAVGQPGGRGGTGGDGGRQADGSSAGGETEEGSSDGEGSDGEAWAVKGTKASKKQAVKQKRNRRMHQAGVKQQQQQGQGHAGARGGQVRHTGAAGRGVKGVGSGNGSDADGRLGQGAEDGDSKGAGAARGKVQGMGARVQGAGARGAGQAGHEVASDEGRSSASDGEDGSVEGEEEVGEDELQRQEDQELALLAEQDEGEGPALEGGQGNGQEHGRDQGRSHGAGEGGKAGVLGRHGGAKRRQWLGKSATAAPVVVCMVGEPNVGKSSTLNSLLGTHRVAVSSHPGRTKHYQTHYMTERLMLCDCPGLVFPRAAVSLPMQILFGSYPIARCRDPYSVVAYLAERIWPRLHVALGLRRPLPDDGELSQGHVITPDERQRKVSGPAHPGEKHEAREEGEGREGEEERWSTEELLTALANKKNWRSRKGRLDLYRAANWVLRSALAGRPGTCLGFLPPAESA